jgi:hypothetical protein
MTKAISEALAAEGECYRNHIDCDRRNAAFTRRVEGIEHDAHERLNIGTRQALPDFSPNTTYC